MVSALTKMLARDLWHLRGQVLAAALVVACGIATLVGMYSTYYSLVEARRTYYEAYRLADVFAQLKRAPQELATEIGAISGVTTVDTRVVENVVVDVPGLSEPATVRLVSIPQRPDRGLNGLYLMRGRYIDGDVADEVIASETFARANALHPGDRIAAILGGRWQSLRIVGTALSPEYVYEVAPGGLFPDNRRFGVLWMNREVLGPAFSMKGAFNDVALSVAPGVVLARTIATLDLLLVPYGGLAAYGRSEQPSYRFLADELEEIKVETTVIPALFLGVAAFLLYVVLSRVVSMQRAEIGLLKAFGYSHLAVGLHFLWFAVATAALGVAIGLPGGLYLGHWFVGVYRTYFHFPRLDALVPPALPWLVGVIALAAAALGAIAAVRRAVSLPPAEAMRPEPPARFRAGVLERSGILARATPVARMMIRNLTRRPVKALLSVTTIALAIGLLVVGRFALDAVDALLKLQFNDIQREDVVAVFAEPRAEDAVGGALRLPGVTRAEAVRIVPAWLRAAHRVKRVEITGVGQGQELRRVVDRHGRPVYVPPNGMILGRKLAQVLAVGPGDYLTVEVLEGSRGRSEVRVEGTVDELLGLGAYMDSHALANMLHEAGATSRINLRVDSHHAGVLFSVLKRIPAIAGVASREAQRASIQDAMDRSFTTVSLTLTLFAAVIVVGMVYNSIRVALSERGLELASLRVLGFTEREVTVILLGEQASITVAAVPLGLAIGYALCALLVPAFDREAYRLPLVVSGQTLAYAAGTALVAAAACGALVARRLRALDLIAVLKARE